jgi:hypothetical protein
METYLPHFFAILERIEPVRSFVPDFLAVIVFAGGKKLKKCTGPIQQYLLVILEAFPDDVVACIDASLRSFAKRDFEMLVELLCLVDIKRPVMELMPRARDGTIEFTQEVIDKAMERNIDSGKWPTD